MTGSAIEAEGLRKTLRRVDALRGVEQRAPTGSVLGVLGPNGGGKTTAVRILTTLLKPDGGSVRVAGFDVVTNAARVREQIGLAGQYAAVDENLNGFEDLEMVGRLYHPGHALRGRARTSCSSGSSSPTRRTGSSARTRAGCGCRPRAGDRPRLRPGRADFKPIRTRAGTIVGVETFVVRIAAPALGATGAKPRELHGVVEHLRSKRSDPFRGSEQLLGLLRDGIRSPSDPRRDSLGSKEEDQS